MFVYIKHEWMSEWMNECCTWFVYLHVHNLQNAQRNFEVRNAQYLQIPDLTLILTPTTYDSDPNPNTVP